MRFTSKPIEKKTSKKKPWWKRSRPVVKPGKRSKFEKMMDDMFGRKKKKPTKKDTVDWDARRKRRDAKPDKKGEPTELECDTKECAKE